MEYSIWVESDKKGFYGCSQCYKCNKWKHKSSIPKGSEQTARKEEEIFLKAHMETHKEHQN